MSRQPPPVYNPKMMSLKEKFDAADEETKKKELAKILVQHARDMAEEKLPFFAQRDDPREGPEDSESAVRAAVAEIGPAIRSDFNMGEYAFRLDYVFRLLRFVAKENPYLNEDAAKLVAAAAKACILKQGAEAALMSVVDFYRRNGIGKAVESVDNLCNGCQKPLGREQYSIYQGKSYHKECFKCSKCGEPVSGTFLVGERGPIHQGGCDQAQTRVAVRSFVMEAPVAVVEERPSPPPSNSKGAAALSVGDVVELLKQHHISNVGVFEREAIDGTALIALSDEELKADLELPLGDRKKVRSIIEGLLH